MPIPTPKSGETRNKFISRCMRAMRSEFPDQDQRLAVCFSKWRGGKSETELDPLAAAFFKMK